MSYDNFGEKFSMISCKGGPKRHGWNLSESQGCPSFGIVCCRFVKLEELCVVVYCLDQI